MQGQLVATPSQAQVPADTVPAGAWTFPSVWLLAIGALPNVAGGKRQGQLASRRPI